jgi:murein DD-endopeptidase MepM/ murein hydrolase activator NlpD
MRFLLFFIFSIFLSLSSLGQKEKGKIINAPKLPSNKKNTPSQDIKPKEEFEFIFEEEPKLRFSNQYENDNKNKIQTKNIETGELEGIKIEPLREVNLIVNDDTSSIDEGELMIIEIEEEAQFEGIEGMVKVASYFTIWDTKTINPYNISTKDFEEEIAVKLYDVSEGRNWAPVLDKSSLTSHFGWRRKRWHKGTDLDLETGDPVYAAFDGIVRISGVHSGYGNTVVLRHYNGLETLYGHMSKLYFEPNTLVKAGETIGKGGNTGRSSGSHLHFETRYEGNQFDPENIYSFSKNPMEIKGQELVLSPKLYDYLRGGSSRPKNIITENTGAELAGGEEENEDIEEEEEEKPVKVNKIQWYRVRPGDNLTEIARRSNTTIAEICRLNKISSYKKLSVGLRLRIK